MKFLMSGGAHSKSHIHGYDWNALGEATVVDMGGSSGPLAIELASKHPHLKVIVQDFANLERQFDDNLPSSLKSRVSFQAHDFLTPRTVIGVNVYLFRLIFHDWPDNVSAQIIQNIVPATRMKRGSRMIVMDSVIPESGETTNFLLRTNTSMDLQMMALCNAKERTEDDWIKLFHGGDKRLTVKGFRQPPGSALSLIEIVLDE